MHYVRLRLNSCKSWLWLSLLTFSERSEFSWKIHLNFYCLELLTFLVASRFFHQITEFYFIFSLICVSLTEHHCLSKFRISLLILLNDFLIQFNSTIQAICSTILNFESILFFNRGILDKLSLFLFPKNRRRCKLFTNSSEIPD